MPASFARRAFCTVVFGFTVSLVGCSGSSTPTATKVTNEGELRSKMADKDASQRGMKGGTTPATNP